ncbi:hypothetical protein ACJW30_01G331900 [Castanea mollissima]
MQPNHPQRLNEAFRKHCVRRWRKSSVLRHPLTFGHLDNLIKSNKALSRSPKHTPFTSEKTEKTEEAHLRNPNTRLCFLPPPPQPDRRSLTAGAALRQKLTPSPDSFLSHRILLLLPLAGFSSCFLLPDSPLAHAFTGFSSCPNLLLPKSPDSFLELVNMPEPHKGAFPTSLHN